MNIKLVLKLVGRVLLLEAAALAESWSSHPISLSLRRACGKDLDPSRVTDVEEIAGHGVTAKVGGKAVSAGNSRLMEKEGVQWEPCDLPGTIVHVTVEGRYAGHILISDLPKPEAKTLVEGLKAAGVKKTVMLTGDTEAAAKAVARDLGIDEVHAQLLPADKVERVEDLLAKKSPNAALAFVGDGVYELLAREYLLAQGNAPVGRLHERTVELVSANAQAAAYRRFAAQLTEEEETVFRRGRNANSTRCPKHTDPAVYRQATGVEALFGWLYLTGQIPRANELFHAGLELTD